MKICSKCKIEKSFECYAVNQHRCKNCFKIYKNVEKERKNSKKHYERNSGLISEHRKNVIRPIYNKSSKGRARILHYSAKKRASLSGVEFTLERFVIETYLEIGHCWMTGFKFDYSSPTDASRNPFAPSIDRKNNSKGYIAENVQVVCNIYNTGKNDYNELDFIAMCMAVADRNQNNPDALKRLNELRNAGL